MDMIKRPRRLRGNPALREMVRETRVDKSSLIYPVFVRERSGVVEEIPSLYGQLRYSPDTVSYTHLQYLLQVGRLLLAFGPAQPVSRARARLDDRFHWEIPLPLRCR